MSQLVDMNNLHAVIEEVKNNFIRFYRIESFQAVRSLFKSINRLCETPRSSSGNLDFSQTAGIILAFSRMVDGYNLENKDDILDEDTVILGLMASLLCRHCLYSYLEDQNNGSDDNIFQEEIHEAVRKIIEKYEFTEEEFEVIKNMVCCADINHNFNNTSFKDSTQKKISMMVAAADILGRMSCRNYLEKLLKFYDTAREDMDEYARLKLLKKNIQHYRSVIMNRLEKDLEGFFKLCEVHFSQRYGIGYNMYVEAIDRQIEFLEDIIQQEPECYRNRLKRKA